MDKLKKISIIIIQVLLIFGVGAGSVWILNLLFPKNNEEVARKIVNQVKEIIIKKPTCDGTSDEFNKLKESGNYVLLIKNLSGVYGIPGDGFVNDKNISLLRSGSGSEIACGYLYIKAGVGDRPLNKYEDIYLNPGEFGGHLENTTAIVNKDLEAKTEMIFPLNNILYTRDGESGSADWAALFNVSNKIIFDVALNTSNKNGFIDEISIVYKCWNPETGAITRDCQLKTE